MRTVEDAVLSETRILMENIATLNALVAKTNHDGALQLIEKVRRSEDKLSLISTFFQTSLYSTSMLQDDSQEDDTNRPAFGKLPQRD